MRDREMVEFVTIRMPFGSSEMVADVASKLGLSRSELMRRAVAHYIEAAKASAAEAAR